MNSKERVLSTFAQCEPDRVPVNYRANPGIDRRLNPSSTVTNIPEIYWT